ncbi:uncharacterized protein PAC_06655 [Phialocephala subalpina]|uniref:F-box domain-containing protein n=1 Tax=Phialocephala subalpina TaxID=576137 RepID=A0A1L7WVF0_9HELO|nr:uncharacterized protein PAC_06655 [Phialocephala subalpina]
MEQSPADKVKTQLVDIPAEILAMIVTQMDLCTAVCFGLAHRTTYNAFKLVHPGPIHLDTMRPDAPPVDHLRRCYAFSTTARDQQIFDRYKTFGRFKRFGSYVIKAASTESTRPPRTGDDFYLRHQSSLIPSPFDKSYKGWKESIVESIIADMKHWYNRDGWWDFWREHTRVFEKNHGDNIFSQNEMVLTEAADGHPWPTIDNNSKQARITAYMMRRHLQPYAR